jgi:hypothetical protein
MPNVVCVKCGKDGSLVQKPTKSKGYSYAYWYIEHWDGSKRSWCYIGKGEDLPKEYEEALRLETAKPQSNCTQTDTQNIHKLNNLKTSSNPQNTRGCRLAWSRLLASGARDPGSNPGSPTNLKCGIECIRYL